MIGGPGRTDTVLLERLADSLPAAIFGFVMIQSQNRQLPLLHTVCALRKKLAPLKPVIAHNGRLGESVRGLRRPRLSPPPFPFLSLYLAYSNEQHFSKVAFNKRGPKNEAYNPPKVREEDQAEDCDMGGVVWLHVFFHSHSPSKFLF